MEKKSQELRPINLDQKNTPKIKKSQRQKTMLARRKFRLKCTKVLF